MKKAELANIVVQLFNNMDQADQFDITEVFYHCDNQYLIDLIHLFTPIVKGNMERDKQRAWHDRLTSGNETKELIEYIENHITRSV